MQVTVALAQIDIVAGDPAANLTAVRTLAATAAARGAELLVLPELWSTGYVLAQATTLADALGEGLHAELRTLAASQQIAIVGSTLTWRSAARPANTATCYDRTGALLAAYDKIHLFNLMDEGAHLAAGHTPVSFDTAWGHTALAICYDLRFPELFRLYALRGARLLIIPAAWPTARIAHWRTLVQARAIENQCVVIAVNRVGSDAATSFGGHSLVVDAWGQIVVEGDDQAALLFATLDLDLINDVRKRIAIWHDRRPDIYGTLS